MLDAKQTKLHGLRFARSFQQAVRTAAMFSVSHPNAVGLLQHSFNALNALLKQTGQFTIGFVDQRIMLNNVLTTDERLGQLETELLKRGIGAVRFEVGLTLARYSEAVAVIATPVNVIEEMGSRAFLEQNQIEHVRLFAAGKNQTKTETGDTVIETDSEAFLMSKQREAGMGGGPGFGGSVQALTALLETAGLEKPERMPTGPSDSLRLISDAVESVLFQQRGDPQGAYMALAGVLQELRPDFVMSAFSTARQEELKNMSPSQIAAELIEDTAVEWAAQRLVSAPSGTEGWVVEQDVIRVLLRTLEATQASERLAQKLAKFVQDFALPKTTHERIQEELKWVSLSTKDKHARLLKMHRYTAPQFNRLLEHLKELLKRSKMPEATELTVHYFDVLEMPVEEVATEELSRAPEIIKLVVGVSPEFVESTTARLVKALMREDFNQMLHFQSANILMILAQQVSVYEKYAAVQAIGNALDASQKRAPADHAVCCEMALKNLLPPASIERLIEVFRDKRDDTNLARTAASLLRWAGNPGIEKVFQRLEDEVAAPNRMALIRLLSQIGPVCMTVARERLGHDRWYVVRNACKVLAELRDPELLERLSVPLRHSEDRVQAAAAQAILNSRAPGRGKVLADALPQLRADVLDKTLDELTMLVDPATLPGLTAFVTEQGAAQPKAARKAMQAAAAIPGGAAQPLLRKVLMETSMPLPLRQLALSSLAREGSQERQALLEELAAQQADDPLVAEARRAGASA